MYAYSFCIRFSEVDSSSFTIISRITFPTIYLEKAHVALVIVAALQLLDQLLCMRTRDVNVIATPHLLRDRKLAVQLQEALDKMTKRLYRGT